MSTKRIATFLMFAGSVIFSTPFASAGPAVMCPAGAADHSTSDAVVCWNEIASEIVLGPQGVPAIVSMAKIHGAIHDAVQAYEHRFEPYAIDIASGAGSSSAAVAKAARDVLVAVIPAQQAAVDTRYMSFLNLNGLMGNAGIGTGAQAAAAMIALRANDGSFPTPAPTFFGGTGPGQWRSTTDPATSMAAPWLANVKPFTLNSPAQLRPHGPPHLESGLYARDYQEVKDYGGINSATTPTLRTQPQTDLAIFYSDNFIMLWQRTLRGIATANVGNLDESARMFALANLSAADAAIGAWDAKVYYNFWRPITAIRNADTDGNAETIADPSWTPFTTTPNYPEYPSGANNLTGSMAGALSNFFGRDKLTFTVESRFQNIIRTKTYERLTDMCQDVIDVRIYQGIHFRFGDEVAFTTGKQAANWVSAHYLRPIRGAGRGNR